MKKRGVTAVVRRFPRRRVRRLLILATVLAIGGWIGFWRLHLKRYSVVREGSFIRVAQPTTYGLKYLVGQKNVATVISLRLESEDRLRQGLFDLGEPDGPSEAEHIESLGAQYLHWPMGGEAYWPWLTPWHYERFFTLFDDPANLPVAIHCMGGRHRTGTFAALYRIEYDRWPAEKALKEMVEFDFGELIPLHEHNLRTYSPRPLPNDTQRAALRSALATSQNRPADYASLVRQLRKLQGDSPGMAALETYIREARPFSLCLAQRVLSDADHPLAELIATRAVECLAQEDAEAEAWTAAASIVADFGSRDQREALLKLLMDEPKTAAPSPRYQAVAIGVTNRYTNNRLAYLRPLLGDRRVQPRHRSKPVYRYCDTAAARLASIVNQRLVSDLAPTTALWDESRQAALDWFAEHPAELLPGPLQRPKLARVASAHPPLPGGAPLGTRR